MKQSQQKIHPTEWAMQNPLQGLAMTQVESPFDDIKDIFEKENRFNQRFFKHSKLIMMFPTQKYPKQWQQKIVMCRASQLRPISPAPLWYQPQVTDASDRFISGITKRYHLCQKIKPEHSTILTYWFTPIIVRQVCRVSTFLSKDAQKHS